jgi:hypothetical protein
VALALNDLLKGVNQRHAVLMVILLVVSVPIAFLNELNAIAALVVVRGIDLLSVFRQASARRSSDVVPHFCGQVVLLAPALSYF